MMELVRKYVTHIEEIHVEGGKRVYNPPRMIAVAAVVKNPWAGQGFVDDLKPAILKYAPPLGAELTRRILEMAGGGDAIEAYGKSAVVGTEAEIEHGSGFIHTLRFGNHFRKAVGATSYLSFANTRSGPGASVQIPLMHKHDAGMRSHYLTIEFNIPDAPAADEMIIALGAATGGRAHHRIGNRYQDIAEMEAGGEETVVEAPK
jgi:hypothetical protein